MGVLHQGLEFVDSGEEDTAISSSLSSAQQLPRMKNYLRGFLAKSIRIFRIMMKISCFGMGLCVVGLIVIIVMAETPSL